MGEQAWRGDWQARLMDRVRARGFDSVTAFAVTRPCASVVQLAHELGAGDIAGIQVQALLREEATRAGRMDKFARELLIRELNEGIPDGWGINERYDFDFEVAAAFARWATGLGESVEPTTDRAWEAFKQLDIPRGWLPESPDDPILCKVFDDIDFDTSIRSR